MQAELGQDTMDVRAQGRVGDAERSRDVPPGPPLREQPQHPVFLTAQGSGGGGCAVRKRERQRPMTPLDQPNGHRGGQGRGAMGHRTHCAQQFRRRAVGGRNASGSGPQEREQPDLLRVGEHHHDTGPTGPSGTGWMSGQQLETGLRAPDHDRIGSGVGDPGQGVPRLVRFTDHRDIELLPEHRERPRPQERLIVTHHDPDPHLAPQIPCGGRPTRVPQPFGSSPGREHASTRAGYRPPATNR